MNRDDLIAAMRATASAPPKSVTIDGWGVVHVRPPTVAEVDAARQQNEPEDDKQFARGACRVICDKDGNRIFDATNAEDVELVAKQPWAMLNKIIAAAKSEGNDGGN
jgi:NACalpha-BTF3-like transcription factor